MWYRLAESEENAKELTQLLEDTQEELMTKCQYVLMISFSDYLRESADYLREISDLRDALKDQEAISAKISAGNISLKICIIVDRKRRIVQTTH